MHANARLTYRCRQELAQAVEEGMSPAEAARVFRVSRTTVYRWVRRAVSGGDGWWVDRSSRPHSSPGLIDAAVEAEIVELRDRWGLSPHLIGASVGVAPSTVWRALRRHGLNRVPPTPRQLQARYERDTCGSLIHIDTKRAGRIPEGGGREGAGHRGIPHRSPPPSTHRPCVVPRCGR